MAQLKAIDNRLAALVQEWERVPKAERLLSLTEFLVEKLLEKEAQMAGMQKIIDAFPYQVDNKGDWAK
jgi:uncharacterized protein HemY